VALSCAILFSFWIVNPEYIHAPSGQNVTAVLSLNAAIESVGIDK
jgi:hypothetical protein